jgi:tRNA threonylcarbamoyladenosine modification (KEOPS) complex  Pcc1 subunit
MPLILTKCCTRLYCQDDDDDDNKRTVILPECETGGTNYLRCAPDTVVNDDKDTCDQIYEEVCDRKDSKKKKKSSISFEESYCECIGLEYNPKKMVVQLRGAVNAQL